MKRLVLFVGALAAVVIPLHATLITFDDGVPAAPPGFVLNLNPSSPYTEAGFTFSALNGDAALFGVPAPPFPSIFPGDETPFLGFGTDNSITLTGPAPFSLDSVLTGPITYPFGPGPANITITGYTVDGRTLSVTFENLVTATEEFIGFSDLQSAVFTSAVTSGGLDNLGINETVPEPGSLFLALAALVSGIAVRLIRRGTRGYPTRSLN